MADPTQNHSSINNVIIYFNEFLFNVFDFKDSVLALRIFYLVFNKEYNLFNLEIYDSSERGCQASQAYT